MCPRYDVVLLYSNLNHLFQNLAFCISHPFQTWWHWCVDSRTEKKNHNICNQYIPCKFLPWPLHMIIFIMKSVIQNIIVDFYSWFYVVKCHFQQYFIYIVVVLISIRNHATLYWCDLDKSSMNILWLISFARNGLLTVFHASPAILLWEIYSSHNKSGIV